MNASLIEARDQAELARARLIRSASTEAAQNAQQAPTPQLHTKPSDAPLEATQEPLARVTPSSLPKTGPDRSDEPESWTPRARGRG